jgi:hypothetical protein
VPDDHPTNEGSDIHVIARRRRTIDRIDATLEAEVAPAPGSGGTRSGRGP